MHIQKSTLTSPPWSKGLLTLLQLHQIQRMRILGFEWGKMSLGWNCGHELLTFNGQGRTKDLGLRSTFVQEHKGEQLRGPNHSKKRGDHTSPKIKKSSTPIHTSPNDLNHHSCSKQRANHLRVLAATFTSDGQERFRNKELHKRHFEYHHGGKMRPARPTPVDNLDVIMFQVKISTSDKNPSSILAIYDSWERFASFFYWTKSVWARLRALWTPQTSSAIRLGLAWFN